MRHRINFDKTINELMPHYLGGRRLILFVQSLMSPLQSMSDAFAEWAKEKRIEASMTSQVFKFEWFLNRKFKKYFADEKERLVIVTRQTSGLPLHFEDANIPLGSNPVFYYESEGGKVVMYKADESTQTNRASFTVFSPDIDTKLITKEQYVSILSHWIDRYRIANKTYLITFNTK